MPHTSLTTPELPPRVWGSFFRNLHGVYIQVVISVKSFTFENIQGIFSIHSGMSVIVDGVNDDQQIICFLPLS